MGNGAYIDHMSHYLTVTFRTDLTVETLFGSRTLDIGRLYLVEQIDPQTLRVHDESFPNGSAVVRGARWGRDWMADATQTSVT